MKITKAHFQKVFWKSFINFNSPLQYMRISVTYMFLPID